MPDALVVSSILPVAGLAMGGSAVTVKGRGFRDLGGVYCTFGASAPVIAERTPPPPPPRPLGGVDGSVRLVNGGGLLNQGRVEIYHDGQWGTVCDDFWDMNDARVVCRQLGFPGALNFTLHGAFGHGSGPIWLDNVRCDPFEERLDRCSSLGWGVHNCDHHEDAGVICAPMPTTSTPSPPPTDPPSTELPWSRLDDFQLTRSPHGAHLDDLAASPLELLRGFKKVIVPEMNTGQLVTVLRAGPDPEPVPRPTTEALVAAAAAAKQSPTLYAMVEAGKHAREPGWMKIANPACGLAGALLGAMLARRQRPSR
jgi:hypothetical protein